MGGYDDVEREDIVWISWGSEVGVVGGCIGQSESTEMLKGTLNTNFGRDFS